MHAMLSGHDSKSLATLAIAAAEVRLPRRLHQEVAPSEAVVVVVARVVVVLRHRVAMVPRRPPLHRVITHQVDVVALSHHRIPRHLLV